MGRQEEKLEEKKLVKDKKCDHCTKNDRTNKERYGYSANRCWKAEMSKNDSQPI